MSILNFDLFSAASDEEAARYRILDALQSVRRAFAANEVYPHLGDLIRLHEALTRLTDAAGAVQERQQGPLRGIDLEEGQLIYGDAAELPLLADALARWALPRLADAIEEGRTLYEFVEQHAVVRAVGIVPSYQDEGYLLLPAPPRVRVLRYAMALYEEPDGRYRALRTADIGEAPADVLPAQLKQRLVRAHPELPNPATYRVETDLDFPVDATLLPVAKRKLLQYLAMGGPAGRA
jgi:hypothetical protein